MVSSQVQCYEFLRILTVPSKLREPIDTVGGCLYFFRRIPPAGDHDLVSSLHTPLRPPMSLPPQYPITSSPFVCFIYPSTSFCTRYPIARRYLHLASRPTSPVPFSFFYMCVSCRLAAMIHHLVLAMTQLRRSRSPPHI